MLAAEAAETGSGMATLVANALVVIVVAGGGLINHLKGKKRDSSRGDEMKKSLSEVVEQMDQRFDKRLTGMHDSFKKDVSRIDERLDDVDKGLQRVESFCIGPDGKNGFRGEIASIKEKIEGFETRERERLEHKARRTVQMADVGTLDRRAASSG